MINALLGNDVQDYINRHQNDDAAALALKPFPLDPALRFAVLDQIKARQKARDKIPSWHKTRGIVFPSADLLEQCSSEATARYKQSIAGTGGIFIDLTAGGGVDTAAIAKNFKKTIALDADSSAAACLRHNLPLMTKNEDIEVINALAEDAVETLPAADLVYIDPQRRSDKARGLYRLEDGQPDITALLPRLKTQRLLLKTSPMLDIEAALNKLPGTRAVHIIESQRECKEVLYLIDGKGEREPPVFHAVMIDDDGTTINDFSFLREEEKNCAACLSQPQNFIYEPGPAIMKAGCFSLMAARMSLFKLHRDTHLYTSANFIPAFPGRSFSLTGILQADRKSVRSALPEGRAHLKIRNFPGLSSQELQKNLGLEEGGDTQIFACTLMDGARALLLCRRMTG